MRTSSGPAFVKLEATGNDFVVVDETGLEPALPELQRRLICDRHKGVGADGVLTILPSRDDVHAIVAGVRQAARFRMHITNPDGSVPEMCGNGLRCVARHLAETGRIPVGTEIVVDTDAGARVVTVADDLSAVTIDMGVADFLSPRQFTPSLLRAAFDVEELSVEEKPALGFVADAKRLRGGRGTFPTGQALGVQATTVSMGNPHLVLEVDALPDVATASRLGRQLEFDRARFPERTNIEWVVDSGGKGIGDVDVVVWERGAGLTQACGTGACAVIAALVRAGRRQSGTTTCHLPGGPLAITVSSLTAPIFMRGPVRRAFAGTWS